MAAPQTKSHQSGLRVRILASIAMLLSAVCVTALCSEAVLSQNLRRQMRIRKKIDKKLNRPAGNPDKLAPANGGREEPRASNQLEAATPKAAAQPGAHSLDGIRERGIRTFFTREEASLMIPGFGNAAALLIIFRQLDLTPEQKVKIRDIRRQVGNRLRLTRGELGLLEVQLEEAIYGNADPASLDNYDPARVKELTDRVAEKRSEVMRLQTEVESQLRQILTPDQFYVFRELVREMVLPGRRPLNNPALRQQQMQRRMGIPPNRQGRPDPLNPPDNN
ncbi:MAG: Spy/CpxP family protein refolding chaperone [Blastocatellales bacterium]